MGLLLPLQMLPLLSFFSHLQAPAFGCPPSPAPPTPPVPSPNCRDRIYASLLQQPLEAPPNTRYVYSGMLLVGCLLAACWLLVGCLLAACWLRAAVGGGRSNHVVPTQWHQR